MGLALSPPPGLFTPLLGSNQVLGNVLLHFHKSLAELLPEGCGKGKAKPVEEAGKPYLPHLSKGLK